MSETPPISPIHKAIKTSTEYAFDPKTVKDPEQFQRMVNLEEETRGLYEKVLGAIGSVAHKAREMGFDFSGPPAGSESAATGIQRECAAGIWKTAQERVRAKLEADALKNPDLVLKTLDEIDPIDIPVVNLNAESGVPQRKVRRSVGLQPGDQVKFVESRAQSTFHDDPDDPYKIILGGQSFSKETVFRTMKGKGILKPMWDRAGVTLPLINDQTGETFMVSLNPSQLKNLGSLPEKAGSQKQKENLIDSQEIKYGSYGLASPDHPSEDDFGNQMIVDSEGKKIGVRFFSIDGSGGALKETNIPKSEHPQKIIEKVGMIKKSLLAQAGVDGRKALEETDKAAKKNTLNLAYAGVVVVDVYNDRYDISRKGDHSVVRWKPHGFDHRRGEAWGSDRGNPSMFQSVDRPQNLAYQLKGTNLGTETKLLEEVPAANVILSAVGMDGKIQTTSINRTSETEYLLILSDGARGSGMMLDQHEEYSVKANKIMIALVSGAINEKEAATQIALAARQIPGERDDISVQIVKLPGLKT